MGAKVEGQHTKTTSFIKNKPDMYIYLRGIICVQYPTKVQSYIDKLAEHILNAYAYTCAWL